MAEKLGALWERTSKKGETYFSGVFELNDQERINIVIFKNNYKEEEKHPDYNIFRSEPRGGE